MNNLKFQLLADCPEFLSALGQLWYDEIGKRWIPNSTTAATEEKFHTHLNRNALPMTLVAICDDQPVGMCSLREDDGLGTELGPWLASLVVHPQFRGQGLGEKLIDSIKEQAQLLGYKKIYLFALDPDIPDWYARLGWKYIGMDKLYHHSVTVMEMEIEGF